MQIVAIAVILLCVVLTAVFLTKREEDEDADIQTEVIVQVEDSVSVESEVREFTMDMLIAICNGGNIKDEFQRLVQEDSLCYSNFIRYSSEYSLTWSYSCELSYAEKTYTLHSCYWKPETAKEYGEVPEGLNSVSLYDNQSGDGILLYDSEPERYTVNTNIREFLERRYDIGDYMTLELPKGVTLGNYQIYNNDIFSGCLMYGDYEETVHGEWTPQSWYALGGVGVLEAKDYPMLLTFEDERLTDVVWLMNHGGLESEGEYLEGCDMQAILFEADFDTFTIPEWEEYKEKHPDASDEQSTSEYWYVFFGKPDGKMIYTVYLNQENFTKEDAIALAKSVRFVKR